MDSRDAQSDPGLTRAGVHWFLGLCCHRVVREHEHVHGEDVRSECVARRDDPAWILAPCLRGTLWDVKSVLRTGGRLWSYREHGRSVSKVDLTITD